MKSHVIILAQGNQSRLPDLQYPKQLLLLDGNEKLGRAPVTILDRTIAMVQHLAKRDGNTVHITVVGGKAIQDHLQPSDPISSSVLYVRTAENIEYFAAPARPDGVSFMSLNQPGNSSLKGAGKVLSSRWSAWCNDAGGHKPADLPWPPMEGLETTVVLLGDVIYSWTCLQVLTLPAAADRLFVGTSDLGPSSGEIWGIRWNTDGNHAMRDSLIAAIQSHPAFSDYQPGQLRRWLFTLEGKTPPWPSYVAVDDYTKDIDLPEHLALITEISRLAAADDELHGLQYKLVSP